MKHRIFHLLFPDDALNIIKTLKDTSAESISKDEISTEIATNKIFSVENIMDDECKKLTLIKSLVNEPFIHTTCLACPINLEKERKVYEDENSFGVIKYNNKDLWYIVRAMFDALFPLKRLMKSLHDRLSYYKNV